MEFGGLYHKHVSESRPDVEAMHTYFSQARNRNNKKHVLTNWILTCTFRWTFRVDEYMRRVVGIGAVYQPLQKGLESVER